MSSDLRGYWNGFYSGRRSRDVPEQPSSFATWARHLLPDGATIWEFGFGTARDTLWLTSHGYEVRGFDFADSAVEQARRAANDQRLDAKFDLFDLTDPDQVTQLVEDANGGAPVHVYGRFLIHSLTDEGRHNLLRIAASASHGGQLLLEFRTGEDAEGKHVFGDDHFRQYLNPSSVVAEIEACGGTVVELVQGHGLAVYKSEDPHVARLVATWLR